MGYSSTGIRVNKKYRTNLIMQPTAAGLYSQAVHCPAPQLTHGGWINWHTSLSTLAPGRWRPSRPLSSSARRRWQVDHRGSEHPTAPGSRGCGGLSVGLLGVSTGTGQDEETGYTYRTVRICSAGDHLSLRISRQIRPSLSIKVPSAIRLLYELFNGQCY